MSEEESWRRRELGVASSDRNFWHPAAGQGNLTGLAVTWRQETGQDGPGRNGICSWTGQHGWAGNYLATGNWTEWTIDNRHSKAGLLTSWLHPTQSGAGGGEILGKCASWHPQALKSTG